jgi:hypothetical protein
MHVFIINLISAGKARFTHISGDNKNSTIKALNVLPNIKIAKNMPLGNKSTYTALLSVTKKRVL